MNKDDKFVPTQNTKSPRIDQIQLTVYMRDPELLKLWKAVKLKYGLSNSGLALECIRFALERL